MCRDQGSITYSPEWAQSKGAKLNLVPAAAPGRSANASCNPGWVPFAVGLGFRVGFNCSPAHFMIGSSNML